MSSDSKDEEMICALTADEYGELQRGLRRLPETMPPHALWNRIRERAEAEGLLQQPFMRKRSTWYAGVGLAATALLATVMLQPTVDLEGVVGLGEDAFGLVTVTGADSLWMSITTLTIGESTDRGMPCCTSSGAVPSETTSEARKVSAAAREIRMPRPGSAFGSGLGDAPLFQNPPRINAAQAPNDS